MELDAIRVLSCCFLLALEPQVLNPVMATLCSRFLRTPGLRVQGGAVGLSSRGCNRVWGEGLMVKTSGRGVGHEGF